MSEFPNVNMCDLKCPRKALLAVELREDAGVTGEDLKGIGALLVGRSLGRVSTLIAKAVEGSQQARRTVACPQHNLSAETWTAQRECADHVSRVLAARTIDVGALNDYERETLEPYLPQASAEE